MENSIKAPVLLIIFNRPDTTKEVFEAIRKAKPTKLYVSADAPRKDNIEDQENCKLAREIVSKVDWECDVKYRFLDVNLGCGWGPASAISWAFENEDRLIILEDDCVPSKPFFDFSNHCLTKYFSDTRISLISGRSHNSGHPVFQNSDYVITHYGHTWGWATWKRVWESFDMEMKDVPKFLSAGGALNVLTTKKQGLFYNKKIEHLYNDKNLHTHVWDFQFGFSIIKNSGLCIVPAKNLIENIGYIGTHSREKNKSHFLKAESMFSVQKEPSLILTDINYEEFHFENHIKRIWGRPSIPVRIINKILRTIRLK